MVANPLIWSMYFNNSWLKIYTIMSPPNIWLPTSWFESLGLIFWSLVKKRTNQWLCNIKDSLKAIIMNVKANIIRTICSSLQFILRWHWDQLQSSGQFYWITFFCFSKLLHANHFENILIIFLLNIFAFLQKISSELPGTLYIYISISIYPNDEKTFYLMKI